MWGKGASARICARCSRLRVHEIKENRESTSSVSANAPCPAFLLLLSSLHPPYTSSPSSSASLHSLCYKNEWKKIKMPPGKFFFLQNKGKQKLLRQSSMWATRRTSLTFLTMLRSIRQARSSSVGYKVTLSEGGWRLRHVARFVPETRRRGGRGDKVCVKRSEIQGENGGRWGGYRVLRGGVYSGV